jgi:DNA repair exonuclease SbcCD ATPase subunit
MNNDRTLQLLADHFRNLSEVAPKIVRAERLHGDKPFGVFYFDFSQSITQPEFDLAEFIQQHVATDFYKHEGSLQWNYYLYFVLESAAFKALRTSAKVAAIEIDRTFARKYVRDETTLNKEIAEPLAATLRLTEMVQDVASQWVTALGEAGLSGIANPRADYAPIIRDYLGGKTSKARKVAHPPVLPAARGDFIRFLNLGNFRTHPTTRTFEFGRVNLIRGVNGTGKTSLLEAIELCVCGGNRRQDGATPQEVALKLQFYGEDRPHNCPATTAAIYRSRDRSWYGGYYLQGNRLCQNFARFNFFDTDAATQLSLEPTGEGVQLAIDTLFLGELANTIEERMRQCHERFTRDLRETQKLLSVHRTEHRKATEDLERIRAVKDTRETLTKELRGKATDCRWKRISNRPNLADLEVLQESAAAEAELFSQATKRLGWLGQLSRATLQREADLLRASATEVSKLRKAARETSEHLQVDRERLQLLESELSIISKIDRYHAEPDAFSLLGSSEKIDTLLGSLQRLREASFQVRGLNLKDHEKSNVTLDTLLSRCRSDMVKRQRNLATLQSRAADLETRLGQIRSIVEQIKGLGQHFCEVSPDATLCPLCWTEHTNLREQLASTTFDPSLASPLGDLTAQIARVQTELASRAHSFSVLEKLKQATHLLGNDGAPATQSAKLTIQTLRQLPERQAATTADLDTMIATNTRLRHAGFTENELRELLDTAIHNLNLPRGKLQKRDALRSLQEKKSRDLVRVRAAIKSNAQVEKSHTVSLRKHARRFGEELSDDLDIEIQRRRAVTEEILSSVRSGKRLTEVDEREEFVTVAARLETFVKAVARIHDAFKRVEEKDSLEQRLSLSASESAKELTKLQARESRAKQAIALLDELLGSNYKEAYLTKVRAEHKDKLTTIFLRIHAPQEFTDVILKNEVRLERASGVFAPISEISTGQRAALALSIFLGLNSSVTGRAPWLLFDDPVAHVDDLNILSFFDMLRDLVFLGDRQVFFGTASMKIADLFARKFDCLGSEFKDFHLKR